jgi:hypothetical protein
MVLDFYDDNDQVQIESGIILLFLVALLTVFYQIIADKAGPEL